MSKNYTNICPCKNLGSEKKKLWNIVVIAFVIVVKCSNLKDPEHGRADNLQLSRDLHLQ